VDRRPKRTTERIRLHPRAAADRNVEQESIAMLDEIALWLTEAYALEDLNMETDASGGVVLEATIRMPCDPDRGRL
jgi:hypothetical protein